LVGWDIWPIKPVPVIARGSLPEQVDEENLLTWKVAVK